MTLHELDHQLLGDEAVDEAVDEQYAHYEREEYLADEDRDTWGPWVADGWSR